MNKYVSAIIRDVNTVVNLKLTPWKISLSVVFNGILGLLYHLLFLMGYSVVPWTLVLPYCVLLGNYLWLIARREGAVK